MMITKGLKYFSVFTIPLTVFISFNSHGLGTFTTLIFVFGVIPLLELFFSPDNRNISALEAEIIKDHPFYDWLLYAIVPVQWFFIFYFLTSLQQPISNISLGGRIISMGILCGVFGINVGHELGHRKEESSKLLAKALLLSSLYMHFFIEHNRGHHKRVSTKADPASARYGENLYSFWVRSLVYSYLSAWQLEIKRLLKKGINPWSVRNEMIWYHLVQCALLMGIYYGFGLICILSFIGSASIGILLLETVNYIEHYGLTRGMIRDRATGGSFEKVQAQHSWNSNHPIGRLMLFELSRHSDHHIKAHKKYQILQHHANSPQLPSGYPGMMLLALFPAAWFGLMHSRMERS